MGMSEYMKSLREAAGTRLLEVPSVAVLLQDGAGRILLVHHGDTGTWTTPGGAIEPLETPADAAVREMWEETGITVALRRLAGVFGGEEFVVEYSNGDRTSYATIVFEAEAVAGAPTPDGSETLDVRYFARDELGDLHLPAWLPEILGSVLDGDGRPAYRAPVWQPPPRGRRTTC